MSTKTKISVKGESLSADLNMDFVLKSGEKEYGGVASILEFNYGEEELTGEKLSIYWNKEKPDDVEESELLNVMVGAMQQMLEARLNGKKPRHVKKS